MTFYNVYIELSNSDNVKKQLPRERETDRERVKWQITSLGEGLIVLCTISAPFLQICNYFKVKFREGEEEKRKGGRRREEGRVLQRISRLIEKRVECKWSGRSLCCPVDDTQSDISASIWGTCLCWNIFRSPFPPNSSKSVVLGCSALEAAGLEKSGWLLHPPLLAGWAKGSWASGLCDKGAQ